jgi:hypothetical protein
MQTVEHEHKRSRISTLEILWKQRINYGSVQNAEFIFPWAFIVFGITADAGP